MGWGRTLLLGDVGNQMDIQDVEEGVAKLRFELNTRRRVQQDVDRDQDERMAELVSENAELKLYLATLARLLIAKQVVTREEFSRFVDIIDRSDGVADGRYDGEIT